MSNIIKRQLHKFFSQNMQTYDLNLNLKPEFFGGNCEMLLEFSVTLEKKRFQNFKFLFAYNPREIKTNL